MKTPAEPRYTLRAQIVSLFCVAASAFAQTAPATNATATTAPDASNAAAEQALTLSPFEVNSTRDVGFAATSSLAGGRLALDLKDTPVPYSVINREFIEALGIVDLNEAQNWSTNSNPTISSSGQGFVEDTFSSITSGGIRGSGVGRSHRNFFVYNAPMDSYSIERFDFGRGPNAILFGTGGLGGVSSSMTKQAITGQRFGEVAQVVGSWKKMRSSIDFNMPLGDRFAVRLAAVHADRDGWRHREFERTMAGFLTTTFKVSNDTKIRLEGEYGEGERSIPVTDVRDQFTGWDGVTTFSGPLNTLPADANARGISRLGFGPILDPFSGLNAIVNYQNQAITLSGDANNQVPIGGFVRGSLPAFNTSGATLLYAVNMPADRFSNVLRGSAFRQIDKEFSVSSDTPLLNQKYRDVQLTVDHRFGDVFLQAAFDVNKTNMETHTLEIRGARDILIDINSVLPNGAPNPKFLQPYSDAFIRRVPQKKDSWAWRVAAGYAKDLGKWGNYNLSFQGGVSQVNDDNYVMNFSIGQSADHRLWGVGNADILKRRSYIYDDSRPYPTPTTMRYIDPISGVDKIISPFWALENNRADSAQALKNRATYGAAAFNAKYFNNRVVLLGAMRTEEYFRHVRQQVLQGDYPAATWDGRSRILKPDAPGDYLELMYIPKTAAGVATGPAIPATSRPRASNGDRLPQYSNDRFRNDYNAPVAKGTATTYNIGAVVNMKRGISAFANYAETFSPPGNGQRFNRSTLPPTLAEGYDFGLRFSLLNDRLYLNMARYYNLQTNVAFGPGINGNINTILQSNAVGDTSATGINKRGIELLPDGINDLRDREASGYELEVTANITKGWRLTANAAIQEVFEKNSFQDSPAYLASIYPSLRQVVIDAGGLVSADNVATVDTSIPVNERSLDVNAAVNAYNNIVTQEKNFITGKRITSDQPNFNIFTDYTIQAGRLRGLRFGGGMQYRGQAIIGNRGADTIVNPANPLAAIDDPTVDSFTPVYSGRSTYNVTATLGYTLRLKDRRQVILNLRIANVLDHQGPLYGGGTVLRPKNGDYRSPARETVPNTFAYLQPRSYELTARYKF